MTKYITLYQIYDEHGHKIYEHFYCQESAEYMVQYYDITGQVIEVETEFLAAPSKSNMINKGEQT